MSIKVMSVVIEHGKTNGYSHMLRELKINFYTNLKSVYFLIIYKQNCGHIVTSEHTHFPAGYNIFHLYSEIKYCIQGLQYKRLRPSMGLFYI